MEKLLIKSISEPQSYGQAKWFDVTDGEGKEYLCSKMEQRSRFAVGQLNDVRVWSVEGKKKLRIELASPDAVADIPEVGKIIPKPDTPKPTVEADTKLRSMACAYAKDLACYGKIEPGEIEGWADYFLGYIVGGVAINPQVSREAPQWKSPPLEQKADSKPPDLAQEAVEMGADVILSTEDIKAKIAELMAKNPKLQEITFVNMMEKLQSGVKERSKNKAGTLIVTNAYLALTDENKVKFSKAL